MRASRSNSALNVTIEPTITRDTRFREDDESAVMNSYSSLDNQSAMLGARNADGWRPAGDGAPAGWLQRLRSRSGPAYTWVLGLIFLGALVVAWAVLPGEDERIEALERDGQTSRALALLESRFARGDKRQRTLVNLRRFYDYYGDMEKSRRILELLVEQRPRDIFLQRQLAQLYRQVEDEPGQIRALRAQLAIRYAEPVCQRLIGLLRRSGDYAGEQSALIDCRNNGYRRPEELERLAFLYAADGNMSQTAQILRAVDDRRWLRGTRERLMLFDALIATKLPQDALRRGIRWYKGLADEDFALEMISKLVAAERNDLALQMARDIGTSGDAVALAAGEILVDQVQYQAARAFLAGWLAQAPDMSTETATRFVTAAVDAEDAKLAMKGAERQGLQRFRPQDLIPLAAGLMSSGQVLDFDKVRAVLTPESIQSDGLIAASIDLREGRLDQARAQLASTPVDAADERRLALKAQLVALAGRPAASNSLVREPARTETMLTPPVVTITPGETQARRISVPLEVAKRFKRRRLALKAAQSGAAAKQSAPAPFPAPGNQ